MSDCWEGSGRPKVLQSHRMVFQALRSLPGESWFDWYLAIRSVRLWSVQGKMGASVDLVICSKARQWFLMVLALVDPNSISHLLILRGPVCLER